MGKEANNESSVISLKGVNKWYGDFQALKDINLEITFQGKNCNLWSIWIWQINL